MKQLKQIFIYILEMSNGKYYTGITQDLDVRIKQHNKGYSKSTRWFRPLKLIFATIAKDRKTARRLEIKIKNISAKRYLLNQRFRPNRPYSNIL